MKVLSPELKEAVSSLMKDANKRQELAQLIVEYTQPNHLMTDFVGLLLNTRNLNPGDVLIKKVRKGIKVWTLVPGAIPLSSQITVSERANYVLDGAIVDVNASEWDLRNGEIGTVEEIRTEMQGKFRDYIMNKVFAALSSVWTAVNNSTNFTNVGGAVTKTALDDAIKFINNNVAGGAKAIVGTRAALYPILDFAGWSDQTHGNIVANSVIEEIWRTGWLGSYKGVPIVVIEQVYNNLEDYQTMVPTDKILVVGQNVGEFVTFGAPETSEYTDNQPVPPRRHFREFAQFGLILDKAEGIFVIKVA